MAGAEWKSIYCAPIRSSSLRLTDRSTLRTRWRTDAIGARTSSCKNGYLVLRYLAEDLAKELDSVLDGIPRSLSARRKPGASAMPITVGRGSRVRALRGALASAGGHGTPR